MPEMTTLAPAQQVAPSEPRTTWTAIVVPTVFLGLLWFELIDHLKTEWSYNPQYHYAWSVPMLALYLLLRRWLERPSAEPNLSKTPTVICIAGIFLLLPLRFLAEANPDWRLLSWMMTTVVVSVSLAFVFQLGGRAWLRHFAFPFLFFFVAVPWPVQLEQEIIQNLMRSVTAINVFFLSVAGVPALQHGNVIEVRSGLIGIEEACSGVRSLQATLMVSLFLGELYSFSVVRRVVLVLAGAALAFVCNVARTAILVWIGANRGAVSLESWHDPAGLTILFICLFGLWALSLIMSRRGPHAPNDNRGQSLVGRINPVPVSLLLVLGSCSIAGEAAVQLWYRAHASELAGSRWTARWPQSNDRYQSVPIPPTTQGILRYDQGGGATWTGPDAHHWLMYSFRWLPGRTAALFVKVHRPDVCLPASGLTLTHDRGIELINVNGIKLPIRSYRFDDHGVPLHVVYCYWDARSSYSSVSDAIEEDWTARGRIRAALNGRREIGAQMLELVVWGYQDDEEARRVLERALGEVVSGRS
jgi:exosortase